MSSFWQSEVWQPPKYTGFKILAIILALGIWVYVTITENPLSEGTYTVPVEIRNLSADLAQPEVNYQVQIRVQAQSGMVNQLSSHDLVAYVDLQGMAAGEAMPKIEVELPDDVALISLSPESIQLSLEPKVSQALPLEIRINGEPAENYKDLEAVLSPELITVSGAATRIQEIGSVYVSADISGLTENYNRNLSVEVLDKDGNNITQYFTLLPSVVGVMIPIVYDQPEASIAVRASVTGTPALGYQVSRVVVEPSAVRAFGDLNDLDALYYLETETIDITDLRSTTSFNVRVRHAANISLADEYVTVVVQIDPVATATFNREVILAQNLLDYLSCNIPQTTVQIVVAGPDTYINSIDEADIVPYVDCSGITEPGEYVVPVAVSLPNNVHTVEVQPLTITVQIVDSSSTEDPDAEGADPE